MNAFNFKDPRLIVKGVAEIIASDPNTGNIIGYTNAISDSAVTTQQNDGEITGGIGNGILAVLPDTTRVSGTMQSIDFSLRQRALITGGNLSYGASVPTCKTITATSTTLTVDDTGFAKEISQPASDTYGRCYVRVHGGADFVGTNYGIDLTTGQVQNFTATVGTAYDVFYFVNNPSAQLLNLPTNFAPFVASLRIKFNVYSMQNSSVTGSSLRGHLYFIVPYAKIGGDAGVSANQTTNSATAYDWTAISGVNSEMECADCGDTENNYAYYLYVECGNRDTAIDGLVVIGGGVSVAVGGVADIPVKYYMHDGSTLQPDYSSLSYLSDNTSIATVSTNKVTGVATGSAEVTISYTKSDGTVLSTPCNVTVTA